jgi:hypothetical protein
MLKLPPTATRPPTIAPMTTADTAVPAIAQGVRRAINDRPMAIRMSGQRRQASATVLRSRYPC